MLLKGGSVRHTRFERDRRCKMVSPKVIVVSRRAHACRRHLHRRAKRGVSEICAGEVGGEGIPASVLTQRPHSQRLPKQLGLAASIAGGAESSFHRTSREPSHHPSVTAQRKQTRGLHPPRCTQRPNTTIYCRGCQYVAPKLTREKGWQRESVSSGSKLVNQNR